MSNLNCEHRERIVVSSLLEEDPDSVELVLTFVNSIEEQILKLTIALDCQNFIDLHLLSHKLCGSAALFGFPEYSALFSKLSYAAKYNLHSEAELRLKEINNYKNYVLKGVRRDI